MNQFDRIDELAQDMLVETMAFSGPSAPGFQDHHLIVQALRDHPVVTALRDAGLFNIDDWNANRIRLPDKATAAKAIGKALAPESPLDACIAHAGHEACGLQPFGGGEPAKRRQSNRRPRTENHPDIAASIRIIMAIRVSS
jgi:hypothetical protein